MLHTIKQLSESRNLAPESGFKSKRISWILTFELNGTFTGIISTKDREFPKCPNLNLTEIKAGGEGCRHFLVDSADVITLFGIEKLNTNRGNSKKSDAEKLRAKHSYFVKMLRNATESEKDLIAIAESLKGEILLQTICDQLKQKKAKPSDLISFAVQGTPIPIIVERNTWHNWWTSFRVNLTNNSKKKQSKRGNMLCLMSGSIVTPVPTHPKIDGLTNVGGRQMGDNLISFKQPSFRSYGLEQAANSSISEEMAETYRIAFDYLIKNQSYRLVGAKVLYWYIGHNIEPEDDPMVLLFGDDAFGTAEVEGGQEKNNISANKRARLQAEYRVAELLDAIRTGKKPELHQARFYAMTISANSGRVVVRDWMEGQFEDLVENINFWFNCLKLRHFTGNEFIKTPGIERIITCLLPERKPNQKYEDWIKPIGSDRAALWKASLNRNLEIPFSTMVGIIQQHRNFICTGEIENALDDKRYYPQMVSLLHSRMAILKAYFIRKGDKNMSHSLNKEYPHPAYHCGRLMYVLASLQKEALPDVKAGVVQRFYAAASSRPALILGQLITKSKYHLASLGKEKESFANLFEDTIKEIMDAIKAKGEKDIPTTLTLEEQSIFALGYYHQMAFREN